MTVDMHRPQGTRRASAPRSPILTYHGITPWEADPGPRNPKYDVHPERFRDQLTHIRARGNNFSHFNSPRREHAPRWDGVARGRF